MVKCVVVRLLSVFVVAAVFGVLRCNAIYQNSTKCTSRILRNQHYKPVDLTRLPTVPHTFVNESCYVFGEPCSRLSLHHDVERLPDLLSICDRDIFPQ